MATYNPTYTPNTMPTGVTTQQSWSAAEAITATKMNTISSAAWVGANWSQSNRERLDYLFNKLGYIESELESTTIKQLIGNLSGRVQQLETLDISTFNSRLYNLEQEIISARNCITGAQTNFTAISGIIQYIHTNLTASINTVSGIASTASSTAAAVDTAIKLAYEQSGFSSLKERLDTMTDVNNTQTTEIRNLQQEVRDARTSTAKGSSGIFTSLDDRLESIETEIVNARGGLTDVDARLDNIEATATSNYNALNSGITAVNSAISSLNADTIHTSQVYSGLDKEESGFVLDARQGKVLDDKITALDTAYKAADTALESTITSAYQAADTALNTKIESIATELGMLDAGAIVDANTRIDTLASELSTAQSDITTLQGDVSDLEDDIGDVNTALNTKASSSDLTALAGRVTILENNPQSTTVIVEQVTYNDDGIPTNISSPSANTDYLLKKDDKYYYWKYINNNWELISGGEGGGGTSSAEFYTTLPLAGEDNIDYFIGSGTSYIHYRWYNNQWVQILPSHLINYVTVDTSAVSEEQNSPHKSRPIIREINSNTNLLADFNAIQSFNAETVENGYKLTWVNIDGEIQDITITGGSGGSSSAGNASITRITDGNITTISGESCEIEFTFAATDSSGDTIATTSVGTWSVNRAKKATSSVIVGNNIFDIGPYLNNGENNITLSVQTTIDNEIITRTKTWAVNVVNFSLVWDYDESVINEGATINFSCVPYGSDLSKTLYLKVNDATQSQTVTTSGIPTTVTLVNNFEHGNYTAEMWMTATINGEEKETPHIYHDFIVAEIGNNTPIIAATLPSDSVDQYNTLSIPFVVYTPNSNTSTVTLSVDGVVQDTREVGRKLQKWNYTPLTSGNKVLTITSGTATKTLNLVVNSININNAEIEGYAFKLKASELPSNNALKDWHYDDQNPTTSKLQFSENFDWINGGIQTEYDEAEQLRSYICIKSGTTMTIPYKIFTTDPRANGMNFKIIFKIENCRDYDATAMTNIADNIGIQLNAHKAVFKSADTEISTQYGEEEYTELEFEVYKRTLPDNSEAPNRYMIEWIDGVMTTAREYGDGNFVQTNANASNIVIGSNNCDIYVYLIKYYPFVLNRNDHIVNFIADAPNAAEMVKRYNRNDILDADDEIDYNKLAQKNPDCRVWLYDIDRMTTGKKDAVNVNQFQQIWNNGDQYYQLVGTNAKLTVQGTSSVNYRFGAANTDIDFRKSKAPNATLIDGYGNNLLDESLEYQGFKINDNSLPITYSNTKVNFASCEQVNNMCNAEWYQKYQPFPSLSARDCMEFAMGVQFIKDRHLNEPADGIVLFSEKGEKFNPEKYYMYSIANMGNSKKNTHIFHSDDECCIEIKENTSDAQKMKSFDSTWTAGNTDNYEMRYPDDPDTQIADGWERFVTWMVNNNPNAATGNQLESPVTFDEYTFKGHNRTVTETPGRNYAQVLRGLKVYQYKGTYTHDTFEYRMAKMLSECEDYMAMDSVIYHFCFIERHTMVDNVAKNTFWSSRKEIGGPNNEEGYWIWDLSKNYDNDTADGNNNNGELKLDYGNEATDMYEGRPVFNGYDAVWFTFASNLYEACQAMFTNREALGAWDSIAYHNYLTTEQQKVPERVWNECYWYDYLRTFENNIETAWIAKLDGGQKIHQRKHYETYEEIYDSSKYRGGVSHNQNITLRGEAVDYQSLNLPPQESKFTITMFNKCYLTIWIGNIYQTVKCEKGVPTTISFYQDNDPSKGYMSLANSVIDIDSGSMVQAIGDLSRVYPSSGQFSKAKRLKSLQIGSDTVGYYNPVFGTSEQLTLNNKMLEYLYVQNLPQATYSLNLSGCPELKYLDASNSGFTGFVFANGGLLNEAYVNAPTSLVMRNLNSLTNANFHITSPTNITSLRLESGRLFDNYTFINQLTNLNVLRLTNINWELENNTLLDKLLTLMGIDESGNIVAQSYLAGTVSLLGTVYEGVYNKYVNAWAPDLTIDVSQASQFVYQHLVTFTYEDGSFIHDTYVNSGSSLFDPYVNGDLESVPAKNADIQNSYIFGSLDNTDNYIPFSGWRFSGDSQSIYAIYGSTPNYVVNGNLTLVAVFTPVAQRYVVRWLMRENQEVARTTPQNYGSGYNLVAPTIKQVQDLGYPTYTFTYSGGNCSYNIMTGWDKLPTNITPTQVNTTYDIYPTWISRTNVHYNTVLTSDEYSVEEKLLVLREAQSAREQALNLADIFPITMGYSGFKPAIDLVASPTRFNGTTTVKDYMPFAVNKSFTMAIDYKFDQESNSVKDEAVLLSCYDNSNGNVQGFKLFYNPKSVSPVPQISFGDTSYGSSVVKIIGSNIKNRGIVVIRHIANDSTLYIYCGSTESGLTQTYSNVEFRKTINGSSNSTNAKIVLGGVNVQDASIMNAKGTLYSVKYWEEDLGEGECLQLASWCHEVIPFAVSDFNGADIHSAINDTLTATLILHGLSASEMGNIAEPQLTRGTSTIGWDPSTVRSFYNNRIYYGLPISLQSIMSTSSIAHKKANWDSDSGSWIIAPSGTSVTQDYIFAPSCIEVGAVLNGAVDNDLISNHRVEAYTSFGWCTNTQMKVKQFINNQFEDATGNLKYTNLRFPYCYNRLNQEVTIYIDYPSANSSFYQYAQNNSITLQQGDILIPYDSDVAYIYVPATEVSKGAPITNSNLSCLSNTSGGWIESTGWWTRSVPNQINGTQTAKFLYVNSKGDLTQNNVKDHGIVYSFAL